VTGGDRSVYETYARVYKAEVMHCSPGIGEEEELPDD
jgi:hypothetical protein